MRRREFITLVGAAALLYSSRSRAQKPANTYLIGYLAIAEIPYAMKALKDGLRKLGGNAWSVRDQPAILHKFPIFIDCW